jgi:deazaflavin-dependent oxidoreductase (nitroreductase family)
MDEGAEGDHAALRPTRAVALIRRLAGPIWRRVGIVAILEVSGRQTGAQRRVSIIPIKVDGSSYLVAFGGVTSWAQNLRAAGRGELTRRGRTATFNAIEVDGDERDRAIAKYLAGSGPLKKDFYRRPDAAAHPVFRLDPIERT